MHGTTLSLTILKVKFPSSFHLDIGCGPGTFLGILNKKSIGIDISQNQIKYAKKTTLIKRLSLFLTKTNYLLKQTQ